VKKVLAFASLLVVVGLSLTGCSSVQTAKDAKGKGDAKVYNKPIEEVWPEVKNAVAATGGTTEEANEAEHYVLASYSPSAFSWGEKVAVFCAPIGTAGTKVEVVSKATVKTNITATNRAPQIFDQLNKALKTQP
jgi:hypothetical protein